MTMPVIEKGQDVNAYISTLEELAALGPDFRANVEEGTLLSEERLEDGSMVRHHKRSSMVRAGATALPDRVMLWNLSTKRGSLVPVPVATKRMMRGTKDFPASAFTLRDPGFPQPDPIEETCEVCDKSRAVYGAPPRRFFDIYQYEAHMQLMHPREWDTQERRRLQDERLSDRAEMRELIQSIVAGLRPAMASQDDDDSVTDAVMTEVTRRRGRPRT